ncbi:MAG: uracil-DNA glycosylase family protein, partial [Planctomycetota bacterium]
MKPQIVQIKKELLSIINAIKTRIEIEKGFGVDTITLSKPSNVMTQPAKNHLTKKKPIKTTETDIQINVSEKERRSQLLEELRKEMLVCHKCSLGKTRTNLVFGVGNPMANLMFVGEAPGRDEDLQGEPFVGRAGQLLTKIIE